MMGELMRHAPCLYFAASDDGTLLEVNDFMCTSLGYEASALVGKKLDNILTIPSRIFQQTHFFPLLKLQGQAQEIFWTLQKSNQEQLPVLINAIRKEIEGVPVNLYTGIIVYHRKKFEDELIAAKKSAETALNENVALAEAKSALQNHIEILDRQKHLAEKQNHELRQFNHVASHSLQEPVRKLLLFHGILEQKNKDADLVPMINKISTVTEQMREVLSDLQKYLWLQESTIHKTVVDLDLLFDKSEKELAAEFPGVYFQIYREELPEVSGDAGQLQLLIYHLLSNAARFRKDPARVIIKISATILKLNQFRYVTGQYKYADFLRIQLRDEGMGFDAAYNEKVFEIFKRLHSESGRGVGLTLCKKIVDNHFGNIKIEGETGKGTTVTVELPLHVVASSAVVS